MPKASRHYSPNRRSACSTFHSKPVQTRHLSGILTKQTHTTIFNGLENQHLARGPLIPLCVHFFFFFLNLNHRRQGGRMIHLFLSIMYDQSCCIFIFLISSNPIKSRRNLSSFNFTCRSRTSERAGQLDLIRSPSIGLVCMGLLTLPFLYIHNIPFLFLFTLPGLL